MCIVYTYSSYFQVMAFMQPLLFPATIAAKAAWFKSLQLKSPSGPGALRRIRSMSCCRRQAQVSWTMGDTKWQLLVVPNFDYDRSQSAG